MFDAFESASDPKAARRMTASVGAALALTALLLLGAKALSASGPLLQKKKSVDVSFRPPPPPPPAAKIENAPKPKPKPLPPKVVEAPPAPAPMVAPVEVPKKPLPEALKPTVAAIKVEVGGTGSGIVPAAGGPPPEAPEEEESPAPQVTATGPVNLPEDADPPEAEDDNAMPEYPEGARAAGQESVVILKVVIERDGRVGRVQVMKGDDPFLSAALEAVRTWRYAPAQLGGQPIAVYRIVKIPFRLRS